MLFLRVVFISIPLLPLTFLLYELVDIFVLRGTFIPVDIICCHIPGFLMILNNMRCQQDYELCSVGRVVCKRKKIAEQGDFAEKRNAVFFLCDIFSYKASDNNRLAVLCDESRSRLRLVYS